MGHPYDRHERIIETLKENGRTSINKLVEILDVSKMTVHRDLDQLVADGVVRKLRGAAQLAKEPPLALNEQRCDYCQKQINPRLRIVIQSQSGRTWQGCCAHCGLLLMDEKRRHEPVSALAADFLYERMVTVTAASYLTGSSVQVCCIPSLLTFGTLDDAQKFQTGFGGEILTLNEAFELLKHGHFHHDGHH